MGDRVVELGGPERRPSQWTMVGFDCYDWTGGQDDDCWLFVCHLVVGVYCGTVAQLRMLYLDSI